jgi:hypothetical protein
VEEEEDLFVFNDTIEANQWRILPVSDERERERGGGRERAFVCVFMCVCVCVLHCVAFWSAPAPALATLSLSSSLSFSLLSPPHALTACMGLFFLQGGEELRGPRQVGQVRPEGSQVVDSTTSPACGPSRPHTILK